MLARGLAVLLAVVAGAWFVIGARQAHDLATAEAIATAPSVSAAQEAHATHLLDQAAVLNPDRMVDLVRSALAIHRNERARAEAYALEVTRAEPRNAEAWLQLLRVAAAYSDIRIVDYAGPRIKVLEPKLSLNF